MREVEDRTVYEPPGWLLAQPCPDEPAAYPLAFSPGTSQDVSENIWWIAATSYLLGEQLGHRMTFTTYSHRPGYSRYHLTGILPETLPPGADSSFQLFDLATGQTPGGGVHPLAAILAS